MGFRLNLKWVSPIQSHFHNSSSSCRLSSSSSSSVRGREPSTTSAKLSFLSIISEEGAVCFQDSVKAFTCSSVAPETLEYDYLQREESKQKPAYRIGQHECGRSQFNLLMQNIDLLESTFSDSDVLKLEREILRQLGRLGALKLFNSCLSRTLKTPNIFDLSDVPAECIEEHKMDDDAKDDQMRKVIIRSKRKERRKLRTARILENVSKTYLLALPSKGMEEGLQNRGSDSRSRRLMIARNEAEMSKGVKVLANLERIKKTLEQESGRVVSMSCWAEAAGVSEKTLQQSLHFGWYSRDQLLKSTRSLVLFLARNYWGLGIHMSDLLQAGYFGVLQGAERFDHTRGYRFSTYIQFWIRKSILKLVAQHSRGIRIPSILSRAIIRIQKARKTLSYSHGKHPDDIEIAQLTGLSLAEIRSASECLRVVGSIDQKMGECLNAKYLEFTPDMSMKNPDETVLRQHMKKDVRNLLKNLDSRERQVLELRFGLVDYRPKSLEEIGSIFHVSKEWIRKIEKKAMTKLRDEENSRSLSYYLDM